MIELREADTARAMLRQTQVFQHMKQDDPERYMKLEGLCSRTYFDVRDVQQSQNLLPPGVAFDLFRGQAAGQRDEVEAYPQALEHEVKFAAKSHPEVARFSPDGTMLVTGSVDGFIEVLSGSFDGSVRVHGLKSGKMLKEFRGHSSYINDAIWSMDGCQVISASSDATVRVWDAKSCECLHAIRPPQAVSGAEASINSVLLHPQHPDQIIVCNRSPTIYVLTQQGLVVRSYQSGKRDKGDFVAACTSPRGEFIYGVAEDNTLYCFSTKEGKLEHIIQ
ncbi:uncharacterized protein HaLaN_17622, partial [Haematococcus lacustris]